jgi:glucosyl-3-phosphoglycerate synthase
VQPLAGEWAARRSLMESLPIPVGYGVELATLMDTAARYGLDAIAQVDLGSRAHRHQANHDLGLMAAELLVVAERRRPGGQDESAGQPQATELQQFARGEDGQVQPVSRPIPVTERPPAASARDEQHRDDQYRTDRSHHE